MMTEKSNFPTNLVELTKEKNKADALLVTVTTRKQ
jgi:hypothetical protein